MVELVEVDESDGKALSVQTVRLDVEVPMPEPKG